MRQAINNLQSTWSGFGFVNQENVFKICDQPHPIIVRSMVKVSQRTNGTPLVPHDRTRQQMASHTSSNGTADLRLAKKA